MRLQAGAAKLRGQIDTLKLQLPALEAEKKTAVAARSFKDLRGGPSHGGHQEARGRAGLAGGGAGGHAGCALLPREALVASRQLEESSQAELLQVEAACAAEEVRVLRRQVADVEALCSRRGTSAAERQLFEQEIDVLQRSQEQLAKKYAIDVSSLEELPVEEDEEIDDEPEDDAEDEDWEMRLSRRCRQPRPRQGRTLPTEALPPARSRWRRRSLRRRRRRPPRRWRPPRRRRSWSCLQEIPRRPRGGARSSAGCCPRRRRGPASAP
ncbi:unnamed protein product, partial [Prorocentrum cordatum]